MAYTKEPDCFRWDGTRVPFSEFVKRYRVGISRAMDGPAWRVSTLVERFGTVILSVQAPGAAVIRMVIPGEDRVHAMTNGVFNINMNAQHHTYYPMNGPDHRGPHGFQIVGMASDYVDGLGIAYGQYDDDVSKYPPAERGNNYGHLDVIYAYDQSTDTPPVVVPPTSPEDPTVPEGFTLVPNSEINLLLGYHERAYLLGRGWTRK